MKKILVFCLLVLIILLAVSCQFSSASKLLPYKASLDQTDIELKNSTPEESVPTTPVWANLTDNAVTARITATSKYIRTGPSSKFSSGGFLYQGDEVTIFAKNIDGSWLLIDDSKSSWIYNQYIEVHGDLGKVPIFDQGVVFSPVTSEEESTVNPANEEPVNAQQETISQEELISISGLMPPNVQVSELSVFELITGGSDVYGELTNIGDKPIQNVSASVIFVGSNSGKLFKANTLVLVPWQANLFYPGVVYPGETVPFGAHIQNVDKSQRLYVSVESDKADFSNDRTYTDLLLSTEIGKSIDEHPYNFEISGTILNIGNASVRSIWIVAILYDNEGKVVGMDETITDSNLLAPGENKDFLIRLTSCSSVESYALLFHAMEDAFYKQ